MTDKTFPELLDEKATEQMGFPKFNTVLQLYRKGNISEDTLNAIITAAAEQYREQGYDELEEKVLDTLRYVGRYLRRTEKQLEKGKTDDDKRFGCLAYGIRRPNN